MASKAVQMIFVALRTVGLMMVIICCALPEWAVGHFSGYYIYPELDVHVGLWKACMTYRTGLQLCETYESVEQISPPHGSRAMTVTSCILCGLSLLLLIFGSDFTPCVQNQDTKPKLILAAAVGLTLAGLLVIIPVSWETNPPVLLEEMRQGTSIYIGYVAGLMLILTGVLLCCFSRPGSSSFGGTVSCLRNRV